VFERDTVEGFEYHTQEDHDLWQYLNFIIHLKSIDATDLNGTESYILELFEKEDISWFPMQKSQRLIMCKQQREAQKQALQQDKEGNNDGDDQAGAGNADPMTGIPTSLAAMEDRVREVSKKF
jgi:hypothetical protein